MTTFVVVVWVVVFASWAYSYLRLKRAEQGVKDATRTYLHVLANAASNHDYPRDQIAAHLHDLAEKL